jgi:hypothetical protein
MVAIGLRAIATIALLACLSACTPTPDPPAGGSRAAILSELSYAFTFQYHACVPLGWGPVAVAGTYYPGYVASLQNYGEFLDAVWRARIALPQISDPQIRPVYEVLNHLVGAGLLSRTRDASVYEYYMTANAMHYYYGISRYDNNRAWMQYLCYSRVLPDRLLWVQRIPQPSDWTGHAQWYRVSFTWKASAPAGWARDPFLRRHSVILSPLKSPTQAKMFYIDGHWHVANIYDRTWMLPALRDAAAWSRN